MITGVSTMLFEGNFSRSDILEIKKIGVNYIELSDSHIIDSRIINSIKNNKMNVFSIHASYLDSDISDLNEARRLIGISDIKRRIDILKKANGRIVIVHPGGWYKDKSEKKTRINNCIRSLSGVLKYANARGVKIAIENLPGGFLCDDFKDLGYILDQTRILSGLKNSIGICLDTGHAFLTGNLYEMIDFFKNDILSIHLQDNFGDKNNDRSMAVDDIHCPPGHGLINWSYLFFRLNEYNYDGGLIFEVKVTSIKGKDKKFMLEEIKKFIVEKNLG